MATGEGVVCPTCGGEEISAKYDTILSVDPVMLRSNCPPSPAEAQDILNNIELGNTRLQALEAEIQRVKDTLAALEQRQEDVKNYVSCQKSFLSPMRRIPPEIMAQIFIELRDISGDICFGDDALENVDIWTILRVCRFWREVAMSCSKLWDHFSIVRQAFSRPNQRSGDIMLRQTLQLTRDCLTFSHFMPLHFVFHADEAFLEAAELLAMESLRWTSAAFNNLPVLCALEPKVAGRLPNLCSLDLDGLGNEWDSQTQPLELFRQAPSLTKLALYEFDRPHSHFTLPWHQITHFTSRNLRQFLAILHLMPSLVELTSIEDECQASELEEQILLPNLTRLEVTSNSPNTIQIFDVFRAPRLADLYLVSKRGFSRVYAAAVVQMIRSSECSLKTLSFTDYATDAIYQILPDTPDLETLTLTNLMNPSSLLSRLEDVLPKLRKLMLRKCNPDLSLVSSIARLLQATSGGSSNPRHLVLDTLSIGFVSPPGVEFFRSCRETLRPLIQDSPSVHLEFLDSYDCVYPSIFDIDYRCRVDRWCARSLN